MAHWLRMVARSNNLTWVISPPSSEHSGPLMVTSEVPSTQEWCRREQPQLRDVVHCADWKFDTQYKSSEYYHYGVHCIEFQMVTLQCTVMFLETSHLLLMILFYVCTVLVSVLACCHRLTTNHPNLTPSTFWNGKCRHLLFLIKTFLLTALPRPTLCLVLITILSVCSVDIISICGERGKL